MGVKYGTHAGNTERRISRSAELALQPAALAVFAAASRQTFP